MTSFTALLRVRLMFACLILCHLVIVQALRVGNSHDDFVGHEHLAEEQDGHLNFEHRHFFNYDLSQPHLGLSNFQVRDTKDILDYNTRSTYQLSQLSLRPQIPASTSSRRHESNAQHVIGDEQCSRVEPNTTDKETIVNLAKMTSDAYLFDPREPDWLNTSLGFNFTQRFGWKSEGLRGHIFTTEDNMTVVVSFKGTTIDPRDKVRNQDRINDNRLFSCCCGAQNPWPYAPVCNCSTGRNQCDSSCLSQSVLQNDSYYDAALFVAKYYQRKYQGATVWLVGHSLGGALASLVGLTLDLPVVTFEAPPERLPAERMGLIPSHATERAMAYHFGNTADPIYMGECNGLLSTCSFWGFSFESKCFTGRRCSYDTRKDKGWRSSITNHRINFVIPNVLEAYDEVPQCEVDQECTDCPDWNFS